MRYAALDLECATSDTGNICEVGVVLLENGQEVGRYLSLFPSGIVVEARQQRRRLFKTEVGKRRVT